MNSLSIISLVAFSILVLYGALSCASENAISSFNLANARVLAKKNPKYKKKLRKVTSIIANYNFYVTCSILGNNLAGILATAIMTSFSLAHFPDQPLAASLLIGGTTILLLVQEIIPKIFVREIPEKFLFNFWIFIVFNRIILFLPASLVDWSVKGKIKPRQKVTEKHLIEWITLSEKEGSIEASEGALARNALAWDDKKIHDFVIPLKNAVTLNNKMKFLQIIKTLRESQYSRYPLISLKDGEPIGIILAKDFYENYYENDSHVSLSNIATKPIRINIDLSLKDAFEIMRENHQHMLIVQDYRKKAVGIITFEDAVEMLFGKIYDEKDRPNIVEYGDEEFKIASNTKLVHLFQEHFKDNKIPKTNMKTLYSWITEYNHSNKPKANQSFIYENIRFTYIREEKKNYFNAEFLQDEYFKKST